MKLKAVLHDRLSRLAAITLLVALAIPLIVWAQSQSVPPLAGVLGKIQSFNGSSLDVATASGVVHVTVKQPLATYKQVPSDLSHVTADTYVGVPSVQQPDGTELAQQVIIFPRELRGAAEGSVLTDAPGATTHSRMTKRLGLQTCRFALPHDERFGGKGRRQHFGGSISGWLADDFGTCRNPGDAGRESSRDLGRRRCHLCTDGEAAGRNVDHRQGFPVHRRLEQ